MVTDGEDNASRHTLENAVEEAQRSDAVIYAIGLFSDDDMKHNRGEMKKARRALTDSGQRHRRPGLFPGKRRRHRSHLHADRPRHSQSVHAGLLLRPIRPSDGTFRTVQVDVARPARRGKLTVRTRTGYYACATRAASGN